MNNVRKAILMFNQQDVNMLDSKVNSQLLLQDAASNNNIVYKVSKIKNSKRKRIDLFYKRKNIGNIRGLNISTTHKSALKLCRNKYKLENYLSQFDINVLKSELFKEDEKDKAFDYIRTLDGANIVIKPISLFGGKGIETNVSIENFSSSWDRSLVAQRDNNIITPEFIIQKHIDGFDIRVSVIEGIYSAAEIRLPPHVVGDGESSIRRLIEEKNIIRSKIHYFKSKLIPVNKVVLEKLEKNNKSLDYVLKKNEVYILNEMSNMVLGAESIDITDELSNEIIQESIKTVAAIPGLHSASIDFMCEDYSKGPGHIIEVNTNGNHTQHHVPYKGTVRQPFDILIKSLVIKHKLRTGLSLTVQERELSKHIYTFLEMKSYYSSRTI